jgi:hypothetical protein
MSNCRPHTNSSEHAVLAHELGKQLLDTFIGRISTANTVISVCRFSNTSIPDPEIEAEPKQYLSGKRSPF